MHNCIYNYNIFKELVEIQWCWYLILVQWGLLTGLIRDCARLLDAKGRLVAAAPVLVAMG